MREMTVQIAFTRPSLGNVKSRDGSGRFVMPRSPDGGVMFLASWHAANMRLASQLMARHQDEVGKIVWDLAVVGSVTWHRRYFQAGNRRRYALHEAFEAGVAVAINCAAPSSITDEDLKELMAIAGRYRGLSPWRPGEYGRYSVVGVANRKWDNS